MESYVLKPFWSEDALLFVVRALYPGRFLNYDNSSAEPSNIDAPENSTTFFLLLNLVKVLIAHSVGFMS